LSNINQTIKTKVKFKAIKSQIQIKMSSIIETVENIETVVETVMENMMQQMEQTVVKEVVVKKSVKPSFVTSAHFKQMTIVYYVLKQIEMMNLVNVETMQSMKQLIGVGVSAETIKTFYDEMNKELENTAELLATDLEAHKPEKKRRANTKKVVESNEPKTIVDTLIEIVSNNEKIVTEPIIVAMADVEKPKRKYTKKPKNVDGEPTAETTTETEKPKRKYTKKPKTEVTEQVIEDKVVEDKVIEDKVVEDKVVEQVIEDKVVEQVIEDKVVEQVIEDKVVEKPKRKYTKKPKTTENVSENDEKPKRKYTKKPKTTETEVKKVEESVIETAENVVVSAELTKESYDEEQPSMMVTTIEIDGVAYLLDESNNDLYDAENETLIGKLVDGNVEFNTL